MRPSQHEVVGEKESSYIFLTYNKCDYGKLKLLARPRGCKKKFFFSKKFLFIKHAF